jgi:hypothetical protein
MTSTWHHLHSVRFSPNQPSLVENSEVALDDMVLDESDASLNSPLLPVSSTTSNILASNSASNSDLSSEAHRSSSVMYHSTMNGM